jgi:hypothetical protein
VGEPLDVEVAVDDGVVDDVGDAVAVAVGVDVDVVAELLEVGVALPVLLEGVLLGEELDDGVGEDECPRSGSMTRGLGAGTLPGASRVTTIAVATPASARPLTAAVTRRALPPRRNSVRRRSRKSAGSAARWAASELTGAPA